MVNYIPNNGDIAYIDIEGIGHEQKNRRPCLVLTEKIYNKTTGLMIALQITSKTHGYGTEIPLINQKTKGVVMIHQIKTLDFKERNIEFIEKIKPKTLKKCQNLLLSILN